MLQKHGGIMKFIVLFLILISVLPSHGFFKFDQYNYCNRESCPGDGSYNLATWEELGVFAQKQRDMGSLLNDEINKNKNNVEGLQNQINASKKEIKEELDKSNAARIATMIDGLFNTDANVGVNANREKLTQMIRQIIIEELKKK